MAPVLWMPAGERLSVPNTIPAMGDVTPGVSGSLVRLWARKKEEFLAVPVEITEDAQSSRLLALFLLVWLFC
jgi:hypothetical protein